MTSRRLLPLLALLCLVVVGCGDEAGGAGADPAQAVPADATVYLEVVVEPEGDQREQVLALAGKVLRTDDPSGRIRELAEQALDSSGDDVSYEEDVKPWLGKRAGMYLTGLEGDDPEFVVAIATDDADAAREMVERESEREGDRKRSYEGDDYYVDAERQVAGVSGDMLLVASSEAQFKRAVDAASGQALADSDRFKSALDRLPGDRMGAFYIDTRRFFEAAAESGGGAGGPSAQQLESLFGTESQQPMTGALLVEDDQVAVETLSRVPETGVAAQLGALGVDPTELLGELPADAWAGFGVPKLGETAKTLVESFAGVLGGAVLGGQLEQELGIDLEQDVYGWIGDVGVFVRGDDPATIDGGLVIQVTDAGRARRAVPKLVGLARQRGGVPVEPMRLEGADLAFRAADPELPKPLVVALAGDRAVLAFGEDAARDGLEPGDTLGDSDLFATAEDALGGLPPSFVLDGAVATKLLAGAAGDDPDFAKAEPYLEALGVIASGAEKKGEDVRQRFAARVR